MPGAEGQEGHAENELLQGLPPLSSSSVASALASTRQTILDLRWKRPKMVDRAGVRGSGAAADADANVALVGGCRGTNIFPLPRFAPRLPPLMTPRTSQQRWRRRIHDHWSERNETIFR